MIKINQKYFYMAGMILFLFFFIPGNKAEAQVPGDFQVNCQTGCSGSNNDRLRCNNPYTSPYVDFSWGTSSGATSYQVFYKNVANGNWSQIATVNNTTFRTGVPIGSQNSFYIRALNGSGQKNCSINFPATAGGCKTTPYINTDEGIEAYCPQPSPTPTQTPGTSPTPTPPPNMPVANIDCNGTAGSCDVAYYDIVTINWSSSYSTACSITPSNWTGISGSRRTGNLTLTTTYTVTCTSSYGSGSSSVTVNVGPPPGPTPELDPPRITNVRIENITATSANVLWDTNEPSSSKVEYCLSYRPCGTETTENMTMTTAHSVGLTGLTPYTSYYIWVKSRDAVGNQGALGYFLFRTLRDTSSTPTPSSTPTSTPSNTPGPGTTAPVISNLQVINITRDSATVTWDTDEPANSSVKLCLFGVFCMRVLASDTNLTMNHSLNIAGLSANRTQNIQVSSTDIDGNTGNRTISFVTLPGLVISNIRVINTTQTSFTVEWTTNYQANSGILSCTIYMMCAIFGRFTVDPAFVFTHSITITGLRPDTRYFYQISSLDIDGYSGKSGILNTRTAP